MSSKKKGSETEGDGKPGLVPKLRFPEFTANMRWKETRLNDVLTPALRQQKKPSGAYTGLGLRSHGKGTFLKLLADPDKNSMEHLYQVKRDDLIVNITFAWEGAVAIAQASDEGALVSHRFPTYTFEKGGATPAFFRYIIVDKLFIHKLGLISPGGAGRNRVMSKSDFLKLTVLLPEPAEQQKIADCLSSLDDLITAQARKVETLKTHKKGLMQQLFPREGETVPRLRFPEFRGAGEWELKSLIDTCWMQAGKFVAAADIKEQNAEGIFPCFGGNGIRGFTASYTHEGVYPLIGRQGALCGNVKIATGRFHATEHAVVATPKSGVEVVWLYYVLGVLNLNRFATGQAQPGLSVDVLEKVPVAIPHDFAEQQKIADCLSSLDDLIAAQARKVETLKTHKKGLMQQLFPSPQEAS